MAARHSLRTNGVVGGGGAVGAGAPSLVVIRLLLRAAPPAVEGVELPEALERADVVVVRGRELPPDAPLGAAPVLLDVVDDALEQDRDLVTVHVGPRGPQHRLDVADLRQELGLAL